MMLIFESSVIKQGFLFLTLYAYNFSDLPQR